MTSSPLTIERTDSDIPSPRFSLPPHLFAEIFPFHLVFDRHMSIVQVGEVLQQKCPELSIGSQLEQHFQISRPNIKIEFDTIQKQSKSLFLLNSLHNVMQLKGQMIYVEQLEVMFFLCSPWITDIASLKDLGLTLNNFAIHDPVVDFLFLLQAQNSALSDAKKLTNELTRQRAELRTTNRKVAAQYAVTHILAEASTFSEASVKILAAICQALDCQIGVLWNVDERTNLLHCQEVWKGFPGEFTEFESITRSLAFAPGVGLPGRVWHIGEPVWIADVTTDSNFPRRLHASIAGLHGAFGFPIKSGSEVVGIIEFFSNKIYQPDDGLLELITDIGIKISQFAQRKQIEEALLKQTEISESLKSILDSMGDAIIVADENERYLVFNPAAERMFGSQSIDSNSNKCSQESNLYLPDMVTPFVGNELLLAQSIRGNNVNNVEMFVRPSKAPDGIWVMVTGRPLKDKNGVLKGGVIVCRDITSRKRVEEQLLHDAFHDGLTGLPNRALFMERLGHAISLTKQREDYLLAVLFLDLDRFKVINDSLGHMIGDQLLIAISRRLETCLRSGDTIARLGGDEFAILLEDIKNDSYPKYIAERIQKELMRPFNLSGHEVFAGASIGIAMSTTGYDRPDDLLRDADTAMYHAKTQGTLAARHQVFDNAMHIRAVALLQLETDLRRAVERGEFQLHYQPIVSLKTGKINGFEALVRWQHPERELVSPAEFIPIAEETGLIIPIGWWVLREACRQMRAWHLQFPLKTPLTISVNISAKQFSQPDLIQQIEQILQETGIDARSLKLEITESVLMENAKSVAAMLVQLQALGLRLSMDDFGTGYSSLSYLRRFPIDTLKIDRSFIRNVDVNVEEIKIMRTVVDLAWNLGMDVVAEGVETKTQMYQLQALKCDFGQGYLFSKPLDSLAAEALIAAKNINYLTAKPVRRYKF